MTEAEAGKEVDVQGITGRAIDRLRDVFKVSPEVAAAAPGRVNLIGEHTDYNEGYVFPFAIDRWTVVAAAFHREPVWQVATEAMPHQVATIPLDPEAEPVELPWARYIQGVLVWWLRNRGRLPGARVAIASSVPPGGGLSSSAALEVAVATLVEAMTGERLDPIQKALACQWAEHHFAGTPCGLMDQLASVFGQEGHALLIDCRTNRFRPVEIDTASYALYVLDTGVRHELAGSEYARRRQECHEAADILAQSYPHVWTLRDATLVMLEDNRELLGESRYKRARHVVTENSRTVEAAAALVRRDYAKLGELMVDSHASLATDYEVSCEELDLLVDTALAQGAVGARMTGGGFGGCAVALVPAEITGFARAVAREVRQFWGREPRVEAVRPVAGARAIEL